MKTFEATLAVRSQCVLGESPIWDPRCGAFIWVDIRRPAVHSWAPVSDARRTVPGRSLIGGIVAARQDDAFAVATSDGICRFSFARGFEQPFANPIRNEPDHRYNEMKCDPEGNIWVGTMQNAGDSPTGRLLKLDGSGRDTGLLDRIWIPNALCWSGDGAFLTFCDSRQGDIRSWRYDGQRLVGGRVLAGADCFGGLPDGIAADTDGGFWNARFGAGAVVRIARDGTIDTIVAVPTTQVTSCAFGGDDLRTLFITTSQRKLSDADLRLQPLAGDCFTVRVPFAGTPAHAWSGIRPRGPE